MRLLYVGVCLFCLCAAGLAQTDRGTITGSVTDPSGAVVPNAHVTAVNADTGTNASTVTTSSGDYTIPALPAGVYTLSVEAPGFKKVDEQGIRVEVALTARMNVKLDIGRTTESVVVTAEAPLTNTENAEQHENISGDRINALPLNFGGGGGATGAARDPLAFIILSPGVQQTVGTGGPSSPNGGAAVNGFPSANYRVNIDGQDATSGNTNARANETQASVDALEEYTIQTSNFAPEFGQITGGLVNYTTRSGANQFHGALFEYFVNEDFNASRPFTFVNPESRKNDFGGSISGPVWIPKVYNGRDRTFFFVNLEEFLNSASSNGILGNLPTVAERQGNFSALLSATNNQVIGTDVLGRPILNQAIYDPATTRTVNGSVVRDMFPGNIIPPSRLDPVSLRIMNLVPLPTYGNQITNNWNVNALTPKRSKLPSIKIDHNITQKARVSFFEAEERIHQYSSADGLPVPVSSIRDQQIYSYTTRVNFDDILTPTLILHVGAGYIRYLNPDSSPASVLNYDAVHNLGLVGGAINGFPRLAGLNSTYGGLVDSSSGFGPTNANHYFNDKQTAVSALTWVHGSHTFKFGAEYHLDIWINDNASGSTGTFNFLAPGCANPCSNSPETGLPYLNTNTVGAGTIGLPLASFMLGQADSATVNPVVSPEWRKPTWGVYLQDSWKATPKITLTYGLRWDYQSEGHELNYRNDEFGPYTPNPSAGGLLGGLVYEGYGQGRCNCTFTHAYPYAIGPRLGLAWQVAPKTVLRAGFGVVYGALTGYNYVSPSTVGVGWNTLTFNSPAYGQAGAILSQGLQYNPAALTAINLNPGLLPAPGTLTPPQYYYDPNGGRPPRVAEWSFGIQREVTRDLLVEANWVGNRGAWETTTSAGQFGGNSSQFGTALNYITPQILAAHGLSLNTPNLTTLLTSPLSSARAIAAGFTAPYPGFPTSASVFQSIRPYPMYNSLLTALWAPEASSWYESLQAKVTKRSSWGLAGSAAFTWSKTIGTLQGSYINYSNPSLNKSITNFDQPYVFVTGFTYEVPKATKFISNKLVNEVIGGWTIGGLVQYGSGLPIQSPQSLNNLASVLGFSTYMNRVAGQPLYLKNINCGCIDPNKDLVLNPAAWSDASPATIGGASPYYSDYRYQRRPGEQMSLGRRFRIRESVSLQVRAEFFNLFNRTYLPNPNSTNPLAAITHSNGNLSGGFGYVNPYASLFFQPRNGQLVGRITW